MESWEKEKTLEIPSLLFYQLGKEEFSDQTFELETQKREILV